MQGMWEDREVQQLFKEVEKTKAKGMAIKFAFSEFAKQSNRKPNSVRNYYYAEIARLDKDKKRASKLGIDLGKHQKNEFNFFSEEEKNNIINKIQEKLKQGCSVRKACYLLSGGDVKEMLRMQNKYRTLSKKEDNVLPFKKKVNQQISDTDISSLFMGLVKLVKRNAIEQAQKEVAEQCRKSDAALRDLLAKLGQKERELQFLNSDYKRMKNENALLKKRLLISTCLKAKEINEKEKQA